MEDGIFSTSLCEAEFERIGLKFWTGTEKKLGWGRGKVTPGGQLNICPLYSKNDFLRFKVLDRSQRMISAKNLFWSLPDERIPSTVLDV